MTVEELLRRATEQPTIHVDRTVQIPGPMLAALLDRREPILMSDIVAHPDQRVEVQRFGYAHRLDLGLSSDDIRCWQAAHPTIRLPLDLIGFLERVNGVHLWADVATSRSYFGILPLNEWQPAESVDWATMFDEAPVALLIMSYHDNSDFYLLLDTRSGEYWWYDLEDFPHPKRVATNIEELLDFWWEETAWLDPRREGVAG